MRVQSASSLLFRNALLGLMVLAGAQSSWAETVSIAADHRETAKLNREVSETNERVDERYSLLQKRYAEQRAEYERQQREYERKVRQFEAKNSAYLQNKERYERSLSER